MRLRRVVGSREQVGIGLVDFDEALERFDAEVSERHDAVVTWSVDPDYAALRVHFIGDVPQPVLVLAEHFGDPGDDMDMVDLVDLQGQAAAADNADGWRIQFHGNNSSIR